MGKRKKSSEGKVTSVLAFLSALIIVAIISGFLASKFLAPIFTDSKKEVEMPSLVGKTLQEAETLLKERNILIESIIEQANDTYPKGYIYNQYPSARLKVKEGVKNAKIYVSTGKAEINIPDVVNLSLDLAKETLDKEEILCTVIEEASETIPIGYVIRTNPEVGRSISASTIIDLYVSSGPETKTVTIPNLVGKDLDYAKKQAEQLNFKINSTFKESTKANNTVLEQSVEAGTSVEEGATINLVVSKKESVTKPVGNKQTIYITLSNKGMLGKSFLVEVETSSTYSGRKTVYSKEHTSEDGEISLDIYGYGETMVNVYIDKELDSSQTIKL